MDAIPQMPFTPGGTDPFNTAQQMLSVCIIADRSGSMSGQKIAGLNQGLQAYKHEISADMQTLQAAETAVVTFGPVDVAQGFATMDRCQMPHLTAGNDTPMGEAVLKALDLIEDRKRYYRSNLLTYYRPLVLLLTDGSATDDIRAAVKAVAEGEAKKRFSMFCVAVDAQADMKTLAALSPARPPLLLQNLAFVPMFKWLSASARAVSGSQPGAGEVAVPSPAGWGAVAP